MTDVDRGRSIAERMLEEMREVRAELETLRKFATILGLPPKGKTESYMTSTSRVLGQLVAGTEETHKRIEDLHQLLLNPRITAALRSAMTEH